VNDLAHEPNTMSVEWRRECSVCAQPESAAVRGSGGTAQHYPALFFADLVRFSVLVFSALNSIIMHIALRTSDFESCGTLITFFYGQFIDLKLTSHCRWRRRRRWVAGGGAARAACSHSSRLPPPPIVRTKTRAAL